MTLTRIAATVVVAHSCASFAFAHQVSPFTCLSAGDSLPSVGAYGLFVDRGRLLCLAPDEDADGTLVPCLRIGTLHVGQSRTDVEAHIGKPWRSVHPRLPGLTTRAYLVSHDSTANRIAYYLVEYERVGEEELVFAVQLTGDRLDSLAASFSCLNLAAVEADVRRQLGAPSGMSPFRAADAGVAGVVWSYEPLPISIEVVDGKVYSFRVWRPGDVPARRRTLTLLEKP